MNCFLKLFFLKIFHLSLQLVLFQCSCAWNYFVHWHPASFSKKQLWDIRMYNVLTNHQRNSVNFTHISPKNSKLIAWMSCMQEYTHVYTVDRCPTFICWIWHLSLISLVVIVTMPLHPPTAPCVHRWARRCDARSRLPRPRRTWSNSRRRISYNHYYPLSSVK